MIDRLAQKRKIIVLGISVERVSCTNKRRTHAYQNQFSSFKEENNCGGCGACWMATLHWTI